MLIKYMYGEYRNVVNIYIYIYSCFVVHTYGTTYGASGSWSARGHGKLERTWTWIVYLRKMCSNTTQHIIQELRHSPQEGTIARQT